MKTPNQINRPIDPAASKIQALDLLGGCKAPEGTITVAGVKSNIDVGLDYLEAWLRGVGCVPLHNLMEDAATAEIARCQIWQWIRHSAKTDDGQTITKEWVKQLLKEHVQELQKTLGEKAWNNRKYPLAVQLYEKLLLSDRLEDFLTLVAYPHITTTQASSNIKSKL